jgi:hypothetical protein
MATDLTIKVLREIRDGIRELREDFNARLDQTNERLERVERRGWGPIATNTYPRSRAM